jgi:hypothetical protein
MQHDYEHNFLKDELNFVLQHSKTNRDARLENNEDIKKLLYLCIHYLKYQTSWITLLYNYQILMKRFYLLLNRPQGWN